VCSIVRYQGPQRKLQCDVRSDDLKTVPQAKLKSPCAASLNVDPSSKGSINNTILATLRIDFESVLDLEFLKLRDG